MPPPACRRCHALPARRRDLLRKVRGVLTDSAAPHGGTSPPMCPPALRGSLEGKARFLHWGRRPVKFPSTLFKGLGEAHVPEGTQSGPLGLGEPRGLTGRGAKRRRWKPQWGFQGHVPDHKEGCPSKTCRWHVFETAKTAQFRRSCWNHP